MTTPDTDLYPSTTYVNPLLFPIYMRTNDHTAIYAQVRCDKLLSLYVEKLNQEIIDGIPQLKEHTQVISDIFWNTRTHGWCAVQFYKNDIVKVFSSLEFSSWIKEMNEETHKMERAGVIVNWIDDLGNSWVDNLYFEDRENENKEIVGKAYLFVWQQGNGIQQLASPELSAFAIADVNVPILGAAIQHRQLENTLLYTATTPYFYHIIYGDNITPTQRTALKSVMSFISTSNAFGAKESTVKEIKPIENSSVEKSTLPAMSEQLSMFAGITRLPTSYYTGERESSSLGDTGEDTDLLKIAKKKDLVLDHFIKGLQELFTDQLGGLLPDLTHFFTKELEAELEAKIDTQPGDTTNEETTEGTHQE